MKSTEDLIKELSDNHSKINRNFSPLIRLIIFLYGTFLLSSIALYFDSPYIFNVQNLPHLFEIFCMFLFINALSYIGFLSLVPGSDKTRSFYFLMITALLLFLAMLFRVLEPQTYSIIRDNCEVEAIGVSIFTTIVGHLLLKKSEFAQTRYISYTIFFALPMLATFFLHMTCKLTFIHILSCHIISPMIVPLIYTIIKRKK